MYGLAWHREVWQKYVHAMWHEEFNETVPVFMASGLLTYNDTHTWKLTRQRMLELGLASRLMVKNEFVEQAELAGGFLCGRAVIAAPAAPPTTVCLPPHNLSRKKTNNLSTHEALL